MTEPTKEQWQKWYAYKSNKEQWIETEENYADYLVDEEIEQSVENNKN